MPALHDETFFETADGVRLFARFWQLPTQPKALVIIVHGLGEHSGRYAHVADHLAAHGYGTTALDLRGHGRSAGPRCFVRSFDEYLDDVALFVARSSEQHPGQRIFALGHSMGGGILTMLAIQNRLPTVSGLILSGAMLKINATIPRWLLLVSRVGSVLAPRLPSLKLDVSVISHDPAVIERYQQDPLIYRRGVPMRTGIELVQVAARIEQQLEKVALPLLILHGTADRLTDPDGSQALYTRAQAADKTLKLYEGFYHEVFNEPEKLTVLAHLVQWLDERS